MHTCDMCTCAHSHAFLHAYCHMYTPMHTHAYMHCLLVPLPCLPFYPPLPDYPWLLDQHPYPWCGWEESPLASPLSWRAGTHCPHSAPLQMQGATGCPGGACSREGPCQGVGIGLSDPPSLGGTPPQTPPLLATPPDTCTWPHPEAPLSHHLPTLPSQLLPFQSLLHGHPDARASPTSTKGLWSPGPLAPAGMLALHPGSQDAALALESASRCCFWGCACPVPNRVFSVYLSSPAAQVSPALVQSGSCSPALGPGHLPCTPSPGLRSTPALGTWTSTQTGQVPWGHGRFSGVSPACSQHDQGVLVQPGICKPHVVSHFLWVGYPPLWQGLVVGRYWSRLLPFLQWWPQL